MKYVIIILLTFFLSLSSYSKTIVIDVQGLVCDFCAQSIDKVFSKQAGVEKVEVNLNNGKVTVKMADVFEDDEVGISDASGRESEYVCRSPQNERHYR